MADYPIPAWLHPQDITGAFIQGQHLRAQMEMQQRQLAQQQQLAAMESQIKQEQNQREFMVEQQRMEVEKAIKQQEISLRQQEVAQQQQRIQVATDQAARQYQAMQAYQAELAQGTDPLTAILKYGPAMGHQSSAEAAAMRATIMANRVKDNSMLWGTDPVTGTRYVQNVGTGAIHLIPTPKSEGLSDRDVFNELQRKRASLQKALPDPMMYASWKANASNPINAAMIDEADKTKNSIADLDSTISDMITKRGQGGGSKGGNRFRFDPNSKSLVPIGMQPDQTLNAPGDEELDSLEGAQQ